MSGSERKESELGPIAELERIQMLQKRVTEKQPQPQPQTQLTGSKFYASIMKQCESILNKLRTHQFGWVFNYPVDAVALKIPDYYTVIKHPMDLSTIKDKLSSGAYSSPLDFVADVRLTFTNAMTYNPPGNEVHIMADKLSKFFELEWISVEKKLAAADMCVKRDTQAAKPVLQPKKRKASPVICNIAPEKVIRRVTAEARHRLGNRLQSMPEDMPDQIVDFLRRHNSRTNESGEEEIKVDIDVLSDDVLLELRKLMDDCLPEKRIGHQAKAEPSEIEILSEYGPSNSSMHPCKGNEHVTEDVDICGNDPSMSSYPSVELERDATHGGSKCSCSSSSGVDSDSSSSDSDSGTQDTGATPAKTAKDNKRLDTVQDQDKSDTMNPLDVKQNCYWVRSLIPSVHPNPVSSEADGHQGGRHEL